MPSTTSDAGVRFEIEWIDPKGRYLIARRLDERPFRWPPGTTFGGQLVRAISVPRALDAAGQPRTDLFAIEVPTSTFVVGQIVRLVES